MRQFVPMCDELLFGSEALPGPLVPYRSDLPCHHALQEADTDRRSIAENLAESAVSDGWRANRPASP